MIKHIVFIAPESDENGCFALFHEEYRLKYSVRHAQSLEELYDLYKQRPIDAIVMDWEGSKYPNYYFERIKQDPMFSACPLVVFYKKVDQPTLDFFKEYSFANNVNIGSNLQKAVHDIGDIFAADEDESKKSHQRRKSIRMFFHNLHKADFNKAQEILDRQLRPNSDDLEIVYFCGLILKTRKDFKESVRFLAHGMNISRKKRDLDVRFLHLLGNVFFKVKDYAQAYSFLDAAERVSNLNYRRKFLLGQLCYENDNPREALLKFLEIYDVCPNYPGIHGRIVELKYAECKDLSDVNKLAEFVGHVTERKLIKIYKKLKNTNSPENERRLLDLVIREFSKYAERSIAKADFYGAVKYYNHIKKIVEPKDKSRNKVLLYCYARLYVKAGDYSMAERYLKNLRKLVPEDDDKVRVLAKKIIRGRDKKRVRSVS